MANCIGKLSKSFARTCTYLPKAGLENTIYLINTSDIDKGSCQLSMNQTTVSKMVLTSKSGIHKAEGAGKYPQASVELVKGENGNGFKHKVSLRILYYGDEQREAIQSMIHNARLTAIIKKRDTGLNGELTFEILGFESGMAIQSLAWSSGENSGAVTIELASEENEEEATDRKIFMDTDVSTTQAFIDANFAV